MKLSSASGGRLQLERHRSKLPVPTVKAGSKEGEGTQPKAAHYRFVVRPDRGWPYARVPRLAGAALQSARRCARAVVDHMAVSLVRCPNGDSWFGERDGRVRFLGGLQSKGWVFPRLAAPAGCSAPPLSLVPCLDTVPRTAAVGAPRVGLTMFRIVLGSSRIQRTPGCTGN